MEKKVSWAELRQIVWKKTGLTMKDTNTLMRAWLDSMTEALQRGEEVHISGLGTLYRQPVAARKSVDVNTGEEIQLDPTDRLTYIMSATLRDELNNTRAPRKARGEEVTEDPIKKLGEQAEEIIDILADLGQSPTTDEPIVESEPIVEEPEPIVEPEPKPVIVEPEPEPEPVVEPEPEPVIEKPVV